MEIQTEEQDALFLISTVPTDPTTPSTAKGSGKVVMAATKHKRVDEADIEQRRILPVPRDAGNSMTQNSASSRPTQRSETNRSPQPPTISNSPLLGEGHNEDGIDIDWDLNVPFNSEGTFNPQDASIRPPLRLQSQSHPYPSVAGRHRHRPLPRSPTPPIRPPLFLEPSQSEPSSSQCLRSPPLSQLSAVDVQRITDAGLGIENMDQDEFDALIDAVNAGGPDDDLDCGSDATGSRPRVKPTQVSIVHEWIGTEDDEHPDSDACAVPGSTNRIQKRKGRI